MSSREKYIGRRMINISSLATAFFEPRKDISNYLVWRGTIGFSRS